MAFRVNIQGAARLQLDLVVEVLVKRLLLSLPLLMVTMAIGSCGPTPIGNLDGGVDHPGSGGRRADGGGGTGGRSAGTGGSPAARGGGSGGSGSGGTAGMSGAGGQAGGAGRAASGGGGVGGIGTGGAGGTAATGGAGLQTAAWISRSPCPRPFGRLSFHDGMAAYDSSRRRVHVLFSAEGKNEHWEWDPVAGTWTSRTPCAEDRVVPPLSAPMDPQSRASVAYDSVRSRLVLVTPGSFYAPTRKTTPNEFWEWDDAGGWVDKTPPPTAARPQPRRNPGLTFDAMSGRTILFGGTSALDPGSTDVPPATARDVWRWDGSTWADATPASLPSGWPPAALTLLVSTGTGAGAPGNVHALSFVPDSVVSDFTPQVWRWDQPANSWTRADIAGGDRPLYMSCCASFFTKPQYDGTRGAIVFPASADLRYEWSVASGRWARIPDEMNPPIRGGVAVMAYDSARQRMFMHSGSYDVEQAATGGWTDRTPTPTWPGEGPAVVVYDRTRHQLVALKDAANGAPLETWTWNRDSNRWTAVRFGDSIQSLDQDVILPPQSLLLDDQAHGRVLAISFKGYNRRAALWQWKGPQTNWTNLGLLLAPLAVPPVAWPAGSYTAAAIDAKRGRLVLFGACGDTRSPVFLVDPQVCDQLWELDLNTITWTDRTPAARPTAWPPNPGPSGLTATAPKFVAVYDTHAEAVVMVAVADGQCWRWDGVSGTWTQLPPPPAAVGVLFGVTYDEGRSRLMLFGAQTRAEWDSAAGGWSTFPTERPPVVGQSLAYDPDMRSFLTLFGSGLFEWLTPR